MGCCDSRPEVPAALKNQEAVTFEQNRLEYLMSGSFVDVEDDDLSVIPTGFSKQNSLKTASNPTTVFNTRSNTMQDGGGGGEDLS
jgi:hypothetical protein